MAATTKKNKKRKNPVTKSFKVSYYRKPSDMTLDEWQAALRKQFAETQDFTVKNIGNGTVFSDYQLHNAVSKGTYKIAIRGQEPGWNYCECPDFKTNLLGTCKHIEYILFKISQDRKKTKILKAGYSPHYTSVYLYYGAEREVRIRFGYEEEDRYRKLAQKYFDANNVLKSTGIENIEKFLKGAHNIHPDFRIYPDAMEHILQQREASMRRKIIAEKVSGNKSFFKSLIKADLFPYQQTGITFLVEKGRSLLADDMGLGKTIQAIGAAEAMRQLYGINKVLVVCPTSLKYQWKSEIQKFTDSDVAVIEGNILTRKEQYTNDPFYKVCSYNVVGRDLESINQAGFDLVILDEAQRIKNWKTVTAISVKKIDTKYCFVMTGTPLENKLEELYSLVQMVDPLYLGSLFRFLEDHQIKNEETGKVIGYKDLDKIAKLLKNILIRRHKNEVLKQLPERMDKNLLVPMTKEQKDVHDDAYDTVSRLVSKWVKMGFLNETDRNRLLVHLSIMRMSCDSTFVLDQKTRYDTKVDEVLSIIEEAFSNGVEKAVIFSQWERMTRIIGWELEKRKIGFASLHGGVPSKDRESLFIRFKDDPECKVFLSTDAGGVGLNLQSASLLINMDLPWNPAVLEQRIARIHRMGQKRTVQIINLISAGTIESDMVAKLKFKSSMASGILDKGDSMVFLGDSQFDKLMKEVREMTDQMEITKDVTISDPEDNIEKAHSRTDVEDAAQLELLFPEKEKTFSDETRKAEKAKNAEKHAEQHAEQQPSETPQDDVAALIQTGVGFLGNLVATLSDRNKTEKLVHSLVRKDKSTGETYLKIPVQNQEIIENGLKLIGQLLGSFGK